MASFVSLRSFVLKLLALVFKFQKAGKDFARGVLDCGKFFSFSFSFG